MKIENWSDLDREMFCGGMFALGRHDDVAVKDWRSKSGDVVEVGSLVELRSPVDPSRKVVKGLTSGPSARLIAARALAACLAAASGTPGFTAEPDNWQTSDHLSGQRAENHMADNTWHEAETWKDEKSLSDELLGRQVLKGAKWSKKRTVCAVDGKPLGDGNRKYCSDDCRRIGSNKVRRAKTRRSRFPIGDCHRYLQSPPPPRVAEPNVHKYWVWESQVPHTVSRNYRLRFPWAMEPKAWKIGIV